MNQKFLILTDSIALPRNEPEMCHFENSWPELFRKNGDTVVQVSIGGATSAEIIAQTFYYKSNTIDFDTVIIQCGIVDCAPRFAGKIELKILRAIPFIGKKLIGWMNNNFVRKIRNKTYTSKKKFERNIQSIIKNFEDCNVYFLGIIPAGEEYEKTLSGITKNISEYNQILKKTGQFIELGGIPKEGIMSDHHHLNSMGHKFVFDTIKNKMASKKEKD